MPDPLPYSPVPELNLLKEFQDSLGGRFFAPGFELIEFGDDLDWFCGAAPDAVLDRLTPFAYATSSGSYYALWHCDDRTDLATLPVVHFGDEGELFLAAGDLNELLRMLADDPEDPDDHARLADTRARYRDWLHTHFGLTPLGEEAADLTGTTRRFAQWMARSSVPDDLLDQVLTELGLERESLAPNP